MGAAVDLTRAASPALAESAVDILIVGAGPTGLTLAAQLRSFGVKFRIVDRTPDRAHESRALAVQARTLEILQSLGLGEALVARGNPSARLALHFEGRGAAQVHLGGFAATDTRFPFILFVSQAETEAVLGEHLERSGASVERGVELTGSTAEDAFVRCVLRHADGRTEAVRAGYVVGCDGAHSAVRKQAAIPFEGEAYLQDFMLGDVEADDSIEADVLHAFAAKGRVAMFFPLRSPAAWRVIAIGPRAARAADEGGAPESEESLTRGELALDELQSSVDYATSNTVHLRDPVWLTHFRLHHRQARQYRKGRVFLAGDAAHIHSPVGAQGMNTGMQDAWNLGWKLALVALGRTDASLLDTYQAERWPVGRNLLRYTDRLFGVFVRVMSASALASWFRRTVVARILPLVFRWGRVRAWAFRFVSELAISYPKSSAVAEGPVGPKTGPRAGERLPDAPIQRDGRATYLQQELAGPAFQLLQCGGLDGWDATVLDGLIATYPDALVVRHLSRENRPGALVDATGDALSRLGVLDGQSGQYLVRPDGYVAFRCLGRRLDDVAEYLRRWLIARGGNR
jgi:2-polyprenyl-6-methoxyphenol hydroxylase-like FAD-dependent oxidoreductase